jgi:hypothetical protein
MTDIYVSDGFFFAFNYELKFKQNFGEVSVLITYSEYAVVCIESNTEG